MSKASKFDSGMTSELWSPLKLLYVSCSCFHGIEKLLFFCLPACLIMTTTVSMCVVVGIPTSSIQMKCTFSQSLLVETFLSWMCR